MPASLQESLIEFVSTELRVKSSRLTPQTRINHDLGVDGDDGLDFIAAFSRRFNVDISSFQASLYFGPEAAGNPFIWLWWLIAHSWPKLVPISLQDLQNAIQEGRWIKNDTF